ncbi:MAG: sensor histidine kinase [Provencibacterium sp.]|jgi:two-component system sensor histidine kinase YesM|nr:sensor histidine kinase [Provencibacterium sp.]
MPEFHSLSAFSRLSIRSKLIALFALIGLLLFLIHGWQFAAVRQVYERKIYEQSTEILNVSALNINSELQKLEALSFDIFSDPLVQENLEQLAAHSDRRELLITRINERIYQLMAGYTSVLALHYFNGGESFTVGRSSAFSGFPAEMQERLLNGTSRLNGQCLWVKGERDTLLLARMVRRIKHYSFEELGVIVLSVDLARTVRRLTGFSGSRSAGLAIVSEEGVLYENLPIPEAMRTLRQLPHSGYSIERVGGQKYFVSYITDNVKGWRFVSLLPVREIYAEIYAAERGSLCLLSGMLLCILLIGLRSAVRFTRPLAKLSLRMQAIQQGDFSSAGPGDYSGRDETVLLTRNFEIMVGKIEALINENYVKQLALKDSQYKMLQTQINPHFLYNTLDSIHWMAVGAGQEPISQMVEALGSLLRETIHMEERSIPVHEELALLKHYLTIQKIRMEDRLRCRFEIEPGTENFLIPKFTLQPLVENSIAHGFDPATLCVTIEIVIRRKEEWLECAVCDNGPGCPADLIERLRSGPSSGSRHGVGLRNIDERLNIAFGGRYRFYVDPEKSTGVRMVIQFPPTQV